MKNLFSRWLNFWDQKLDWRVQIIFPIFYSFLISIICLVYLEINTLQIIGFLLIVLGFSVLLVARFELRDQFSTKTRESKKIINKGIYKIFRHPIYLGSVVALLGLVIYLIGKGLPIFIILSWIIFLFIQIKRAKKEEKLLAKKFGEEYKTYCKQTWF